MDGWRWLLSTLRGHWRERTFSIAFVATLGLGIGANTAIFSVVRGVLLRPLPYPEADRIVVLRQPAGRRGLDDLGFSFVEVADYRSQSTTLDEIVEFGDWTFNVLGRGEPHRAMAGLVTSNFFEVLGMRPQLGRLLVPTDREQGAAPVVVLTDGYWRAKLGADPDVVGQTLDLTAKKATIVGVLAPGSHYASERHLDFYGNYATNDHYLGASMQEERRHRMTSVLGRLAPGASLEQARAELAQIAGRLHAEYPDDYPTGWGVATEAVPWKEELVSRARPTLLLLLAAAGFVLVIACANVANLTLARTLRRERELAVRSALGAGWRRLRAQLFGECAILAVLGGVLGVLIARGLLEALVAYAQRFTSRTGEVEIDGAVLGFSLLIATVSALAFSLLPGLVPGSRLSEVLAGGGGHSTGSRSRRVLQRSLVVGQLAVSFVLLVGAGLMARTLWNLHAVEPGFDLENVLSLDAPKFGPASRDDERQFTDRLLERLSGQAGVQSAAMTQHAPLGGTRTFPMNIKTESGDPDAEVTPLPVVFETVTDEYFDTLGVPVLEGRAFAAGDRSDSAKVAVLNRSLASHLFGEQSPLGRRISYSFGGPFGDWLEVVGVVADTRTTQLDQAEVPALYLPERQSFAPSTVLVRTAARPDPMTPMVIESIRQLDPERPIEHVQTLAELRDESLAPQRLNAVLFGSFAVLALLIAAVGVGALLAFAVSARRRELAIRAATGASPRELLAMVLREGAGMAVLGVALGVGGAVGLVRFLSGLLYEVEPLDGGTFLTVGATLLAVAVGASLWPARRATLTAPMEVLRAE